MITYKTFMEKLFDGQFVRKSEQDEAMEVLQSIGKFVDSRKVSEDRMALRNEIFVLVKRPMTAKGTGYLIAQVVDDSGGSGIDNAEVDAKIIKNYGGNDYKVGENINISIVDSLAVSQDNKRWYVVYPSRHPQSSTGGGADVSYKVNDVGDDEDLEKSVEKDDDEKASAFLSKLKAQT